MRPTRTSTPTKSSSPVAAYEVPSLIGSTLSFRSSEDLEPSLRGAPMALEIHGTLPAEGQAPIEGPFDIEIRSATYGNICFPGIGVPLYL